MISKTSDRISQNSTHRNLLRPSIYLTWKVQVQIPGHTLPKSSEDRGLLLHIHINPKFISTKWHYHSIQRTSIYKAQKYHHQHATTHCHKLSMTNGLVPQNCANLFTISQNWHHSLQSTKHEISGPKHEPRTSRISDKCCLNETRTSISTHALTHSGSYLPNLKSPGLDSQPCTAKSFRGSRPTPSYSYKSRIHFKEMALPLDPEDFDLQSLERSSSTHHHALPQTLNNQQFSPSKLCKFVHNFTKLTP